MMLLPFSGKRDHRVLREYAIAPLRAEFLDEWEAAKNRKPLSKIEPLE
jgi:hypothetical protein